MIRWVVRLVSLLVVGLVLYLGVTFVQVWQASRRDEAQAADAIVVFGAAQYNGRPSPVLQARLDHAFELWQQDLAPIIAVTGGRREGDRFTEAGTAYNELRDQGVPDGSLLLERQGRTSWESMVAAAELLERQGRTEVLLVSDPFHSARITAIAREVGLEPHVSPTRDSPISGRSELRLLGRETLAVAAGRVIGFRRLSGVDERVRERVALGMIVDARSGVV